MRVRISHGSRRRKKKKLLSSIASNLHNNLISIHKRRQYYAYQSHGASVNRNEANRMRVHIPAYLFSIPLCIATIISAFPTPRILSLFKFQYYNRMFLFIPPKKLFCSQRALLSIFMLCGHRQRIERRSFLLYF